MRREEAWQVIFEIMEDETIPLEEKPKRILAKLESLGMLPPRAYLEKLKISDNAWE